MAHNSAWGIDIGDSAIKAVRLKKVGDSVVVQDYRTIPCESRPEEAQASDKEYRVRNALATLEREVNLRGSTIVVSNVSRSFLVRRTNRVPVKISISLEVDPMSQEIDRPWPRLV